MLKPAYYIINGITLYRLIAAPFLLVLILNREIEIFRWLIAFSFLTDAIDGFLARHYKIASILGAKLDSIADDLTILVAITGLIILKPEFVWQQLNVILVVFGLFVIQNIFAIMRYKKITSFHTYLAKMAAVFQGIFFISFFFTSQPVYPLFYAAVIITMLDLIEEIILVWVLPDWKTNVKGLFWILKNK